MATADKRRIFIDCQVFQYNAWNRGMGRYTLNLLEALDKEVINLTLIFNKNIDIEQDRLEIIAEKCPSASILYLKLSDDPNKCGGWQKLQELCATELDDQLKDVMVPGDTFLIASNFALRYCSTFPNLACKKALIFYDLTPYLHWKDYRFTQDFEPKKYFAQFKTLFRADQLWAISQSAADELKNWLGIDARRIQNIRGASIRNTQVKMLKPPTVNTPKFILCPSADGPNKNNENMVRAFAEFNNETGGKYKLVITSGFSDQSKAVLGAISADVIFSDHVSDGELGWLYEHCDALFFASKTEGLGLPILEAVTMNKKVICSDIKVFREISNDAFYFADPNNVQSITRALHQGLIVAEEWENKKKLYPEINYKFSWKVVAQTCLELIDKPLVVDTGSELLGAQVTWYADSDKKSLARDAAEILYSVHQGADFRALRSVVYYHAYPSYLVEMGSAVIALGADKVTADSTPVYIIDNSQESAQLLLYALQVPGLVVATFKEADTPGDIEKYLAAAFDKKITYKTLIKFIAKAGGSIIYEPKFSKRGTEEFIQEVYLLDNRLIKIKEGTPS
jgi:glycosyltransferase involved in cell wall biosynthesis